jgi:hypothetical protein
VTFRDVIVGVFGSFGGLVLAWLLVTLLFCL